MYTPMPLPKDLDLTQIIKCPEEARHYVLHFEWRQPAPPGIALACGREIYFKRMTDEEAVLVANELLHSVQIPRDLVEKNLLPWDH